LEEKIRRRRRVPKYVIEREIPGAGNLTAQQLRVISQASCGIVQTLGPQIQWVQSYVSEDKIYCVYIASNAEIIREHARRGQFPVSRIAEVRSVIDPTTAEAVLTR
jgi:riboflavin synthase